MMVDRIISTSGVEKIIHDSVENSPSSVVILEMQIGGTKQ